MIVSQSDKMNRIKYIFLVAGFVVVCCLMKGNLVAYMYAGLALFIIGTFFRLNNHFRIEKRWSRFKLWIVLTWSYILINALFLSDQYFGWKSILIYLLPAIAIMQFYSPFDDKDELYSIFCKGCEIGAGILTVYIIFNELPTILSGGARIGDSASGNVNSVAMNLSVFALVIYFEIMFEQKKKLWFLFLVCILFILLTGSKKGLLGIAVTVILVSVFKYRWRIYKYALPVILIGIVIYLLQNNSYLYSIIGRRVDAFIYALETNQTNGSTGERVGMIKSGWEFFRQSPFFGNGYGYFAANSGYGTYSHNNYIEMLVGFGLVGTGLYYSLFVALLVKSAKLIKDDYRAVLFFSLIVLQLTFDFAAIGYYSNAMVYLILYFVSKMYLSKNYNAPSIYETATEEKKE